MADERRTHTRQIGPLSLRAAFRPGSVDAEKRTVDLTWTTGARVLRQTWDGSFWEELSMSSKHVRMDRLKSGRAPLLNAHASYDLGSVIGVVEKAKIEGKEGVATVRFARAEDDPAADAIFRKVQDGIIGNVSVGYRIHRLEKVEEDADKIPVMRATDWEPLEVSLVPLGADAGAGVRSEQELAPCEFVFHREESAMADPTAAPVVAPVTAPAAPAVVSPPAPSGDAQRTSEVEAATRAERERASAIRDLGKRHHLEALADDLISRGGPLADARAAVLDELAKRDEKLPPHGTQLRVEVGEEDRDKFLRNAQALLFVRSGVAAMLQRAKAADRPELARHFKDLALEPEGLHGLKLVDLARECLERRGVRTRGWSGRRVVKAALARGIEGGNSTSDFAVLLENTTHKALLGGYVTEPDTWRRFCGVKNVSDLRAHNFYRTGSFGELDDVNEGGEYKSKVIPDGEKASITITKKGNVIALTEEAIVNDDLGVFNDLAAGLGRAAALSIEKAVYTLLALNSGLGPTQTDTSPFFDDTARSNVSTGAALSAAALDADAVKMAYQKDPSSNEVLNLSPAVLLVPKGLERQAIGINNDIYDPDTANKLQKSNPARGMFRDIVASARLTAGSTRRYVFADPATYPAIVVAFLDGQQAPTLESREGWEVDGVEWKVKHYFKVKEFDYRAAVTNAGA